MKYLNLGCGSRYHSNWKNVDFTTTGSNVIAYDLTVGIPSPNNSFDVVYHSHLLEHFSKYQASIFLDECYRVLNPNGIIRIVVPDLEQISRSYIFALEQAISGLPEPSDNYNWLLIEMLDQMTRNFSGGEMFTYLTQEHIPNEDFVLKRIGTEAQKLIEAGHYQKQFVTSDFWLEKIFRIFCKFLKDSDYRWNSFLKVLLGSRDYKSLQIGRFRQSGEIHQWMYDRYSLARLLSQHGFVNIVQQTASNSYIADWSSFNLDTESDGTLYKPDSLYIEAVKPLS